MNREDKGMIVIIGLVIAVVIIAFYGGFNQWKDTTKRIVPIVENITVSDRVVIANDWACPCTISTTDNRAFNVLEPKDCARLTPGTTVEITVVNEHICEVINVRKIP
jgi:hypothetical protein